MPNRSKQKGDREERDVVHTLRDKGFNAQRTLESGKRPDGSDTWDINLFLDYESHDVLTIECKIKKDGYSPIYKQKGNADVLTIRANNKERLYVVNESLFCEMVNALLNSEN